MIAQCGRLLRFVANWASEAEELVMLRVVCVSPGDDLVVNLGFRGYRRYYERQVSFPAVLDDEMAYIDVNLALNRMRDELAEEIRADLARPRRRRHR